MLSFSIIFINMFFYAIIIPLVKSIGFYRKNREEDQNLRLIVICSILDMVALPIFIGTNLTEKGWNFFRGKHPDFDNDWYPLIGRPIATTMLIFAF